MLKRTVEFMDGDNWTNSALTIMNILRDCVPKSVNPSDLEGAQSC
jgi:hypothetical protein